MEIKINDFITDDEVKFFRDYCRFAISNPSKQVSLKVKKEYQFVDRLYYSINSPFSIFDRVRKIAEKNCKVPITFRKDSYAHIMRYKEGSKGLGMHADQNLGWVSASINLTHPSECIGGEFRFKNSLITSTYKSLVMYDYTVMHQVTPVTKGEKWSLVLWLPKKGQKVSGGKTWRFK